MWRSDLSNEVPAEGASQSESLANQKRRRKIRPMEEKLIAEGRLQLRERDGARQAAVLLKKSLFLM